MSQMQRQLQSRIAKRANFIAHNEQTIAALKANGFGYRYYAQQREMVKQLAKDQKLDRSLLQLVYQRDRCLNYYGLLG